MNCLFYTRILSITGVAYSKRLLYLYTKNGNYFEKQWEVSSITPITYPSVLFKIHVLFIKLIFFYPD